jgi:hypothetical protein
MDQYTFHTSFCQSLYPVSTLEGRASTTIWHFGKSLLFRGRLHVSDSAYESRYDFVHDLHTKGFGFGLSIQHHYNEIQDAEDAEREERDVVRD